jgi:hypothetical protein
MENYITEPSFGSRLHRHGYKFILGDAKKVVVYKNLPRQALGAPMLPVSRGVGYGNISQCVYGNHLDIVINPLIQKLVQS